MCQYVVCFGLIGLLIVYLRGQGATTGGAMSNSFSLPPWVNASVSKFRKISSKHSLWTTPTGGTSTWRCLTRNQFHALHAPSATTVKHAAEHAGNKWRRSMTTLPNTKRPVMHLINQIVVTEHQLFPRFAVPPEGPKSTWRRADMHSPFYLTRWCILTMWT